MAIRNLIMRHSNFRIFEEYYLLQRVRHDIQAVYLECPSEDGFIKAVGQMSRFINPQQLKTFSNNQLVQIREYSKVLELSRSRALLYNSIISLYGKICKSKETTIYTKYAQLGLALFGKKQYQKKVLLKNVWGIYCQEAPINNIQKQFDETFFLIDIDIDPITIAFAKRSWVAKAFFFGSISLETKNHSWKTEAIKDLISFGTLKEVRHCYTAHQRGPLLNTNNEELLFMEVNPLEDELLKIGSENGKPERLRCITLKCEFQ